MQNDENNSCECLTETAANLQICDNSYYSTQKEIYLLQKDAFQSKSVKQQCTS